MKKLTETQQLYNSRLEKKVKIEIDDNQKEFERLKKAFFRIDTDETLAKWKILSKAYNLGKEIHKIYSVKQLSIDFDIPYTTVKRILSLNRATGKTWELIKGEKISSFKAAQVCMAINKKYQDQVIEMVMKDNLSTYDIKKIRLNRDIKKIKLDKAVREGYARKDTAYKSLKDTLTRLNKLLELDKLDLPDKIDHLIKLMEYTRDKLESKIEEFI